MKQNKRSKQNNRLNKPCRLSKRSSATKLTGQSQLIQDLHSVTQVPSIDSTLNSMAHSNAQLDLLTEPESTFKGVAVEVRPLTGINKSLAYKVEAKDQANIQVGSLVKIPLRNRSILGVVDALETNQNLPLRKMKAIQECLYKTPIMTPELLKLAKWLETYYASSPEAVYETMIPAAIRKGVQPKVLKFLKIKTPIEPSDLEQLKKKAPKQAQVYEYLLGKAHSGALKSKLLEDLGVGPSSCTGLIEKGYIEEFLQEEMREAYMDEISKAEVCAAQSMNLTDEQAAAALDIGKSIDEAAFKVHLLHGVTGSGKTEVYFDTMIRALRSGGSVLFLVPEVALTPQTVSRLRARFQGLGIKSVVWHSKLSAGERFDAWMSLAKGESHVVVGARSAIFAPVPNLKLIIVDEEHEPAYKQGESPRYHGRDVAVYRAFLNNAVCVLGSATPSLESLYNVQKKGYKLNKLTKRVDDRELPKIRIVDMKMELLKAKKQLTISTELAEKLRARYEAKEQSILFLNRRGYSSKLLCPECAYIAECTHCSVTLTYHRTDGKLRCHICGHQENAPKICPGCQSTKIRGQGTGTQRVEDVVEKLLPGAKVVRMDADSMSKKNRFREILADFRKGKIDVLVGTQMIAKGLDFPNVTLVGLIDADLSLHIQDFRAGERTFQLVVQVAGRAGRGDRAGEVVVQTFTPHSDPIQFARKADFDGYLEGELEQRKEFNYPPYRHIIRHIFRGKNCDRVHHFAEAWTSFLTKHLGDKVEIRGPAPAPLEKVKDNYRYHTWIFLSNVSKVLPEILRLREAFESDKEVIDVFDVDPVDMS